VDTAELLAWEPVLRLSAFLAVLAAMVVWELGRPQQRLQQPRRLRWTGNLGIAAVNALVARFALPVAPVGAAMFAAERDLGLFNLTEVPAWLACAVPFLALDLAIYGQHYAMHKVPLLWRLHRMHHADIELDVTTGLRFHPFEIVFSLLFKVAVVVALGAPVLAVMIFEIVLNATSMFTHANIRLPGALDRHLRLVLVTPLMHRGHHSVVRAETDSNFAFNFAWWDRLFGTYRAAPAEGYDRMTIGIPAFRDPASTRITQLLIQPFLPEK
jgi:sterol desaturase/sphingolipid hydroxylase (fatty acid hydroxylase superfamily)